MSPEEYIKRLKALRRKTRAMHHEVDSAVDHMERRLETGYTFQEDDSKRGVMWAIENVKDMMSELETLYNAKIEY